MKSNKSFTLATSLNDIPYCATCFYAFDEATFSIIFLSDETTRHISEALSNPKVAGTIVSNVTTVAKIQGIQFVGQLVALSSEQEQEDYAIYYRKFPFAKTRPSSIWRIQLQWIKMTDNTLGFGSKVIWEL